MSWVSFPLINKICASCSQGEVPSGPQWEGQLLKLFGTSEFLGPLTWILDLRALAWLPGIIDRAFWEELGDSLSRCYSSLLDASMWDPQVQDFYSTIWSCSFLFTYHFSPPIFTRLKYFSSFQGAR